MKTRGEKGKEIIKVILSVIGAAGLVSVALVAPNAVQILKIFDKRKKSWTKYHIKNRLSQLISEGFIIIKNKNGKNFLVLTKKGQLLLEKYKRTEKPKKWDGVWRVVIFDISEKRRRQRDLLRQELREYGFKKLQQSVWVSPYPCENFITLLKSDMGLGAKVLYMETTKLEYDKKLKELFDL